MNLKNIRKEKGLTLSEVANALKISTQDYRSLEEEKIEPSISQLMQLADFFNLSVDEIVGYKHSIALSHGEIVWLNIRKSFSKDKLQLIAQMLNGVNDLQLSEKDIECLCDTEKDVLTHYEETERMSHLFCEEKSSESLTFDDYLLLYKIYKGEKIPIDFKGNTIITDYSFTYDGKVYNKDRVAMILDRLAHQFDFLNYTFVFHQTKNDVIPKGALPCLKRKAKALIREKEVEFHKDKES